MKAHSYILPIMTISALLTACSGGGNSGGSSHTQPAAVNPQTVVKENKQKEHKTSPKPMEKPAVVEKKPVEKPVVVENNPVEKKPVVVENKPVEKPAVAENKPVEKPAVVENKPAEKPVVVENKPAEKPAAVENKLAENKPVEEKVLDKEEIWSGGFAHNKNNVPVYYLIENEHAVANEDPNLTEKKQGSVQLKKGHNIDPQNNYHFYLLDDNAYYGYYRDSKDMRTVDSHLVYGFNENAENKGDLSQLTAKYKGEFWYTNRSVPNVVTTSSVDLQYENGSANGAIYSKQETDYKLFDIASTNNPRELEITPSSTWLDNSTEDLVPGKNSPHRALLNVHFINGKDGTENKSLVGKGGNDVFYGVIGAEKQ